MADTPPPIVDAIRADLRAAADPSKATAMQAYMKTTQPFYGVQSKQCQRLFRAALRAHPPRDRAAYEAAVTALWHGAHREEMYQALRLAEQTRSFYGIPSWSLYEELVRTAPWWDTLDWLAGNIVGPLIGRHPALKERLLVWRHDENMWVRRAALLAHLKQKSATDVPLLAETILLLAHEREFFIRKAIGWVLRDYSYTDPEWVEKFVADHAGALSPLSRREALKAINRRRA